jgi:hypothetical protein
MAVNPKAAINPVVELNSVFVGFFYELFSIMLFAYLDNVCHSPGRI